MEKEYILGVYLIDWQLIMYNSSLNLSLYTEMNVIYLLFAL